MSVVLHVLALEQQEACKKNQDGLLEGQDPPDTQQWSS